MKGEIPSFLLSAPRHNSKVTSRGRVPASFFDKGINCAASIIKTTYVEWDTAQKQGLLQQFDARVKILFLLIFILMVSLKKGVLPEITIGLLTLALVVTSRIKVIPFLKRTAILCFLFGFLPALPSILNIFVKGELVFPLVYLSKPYDFWVYHIPATIGITQQGLESWTMLTLRVFNSLSLSYLVICTTPFPQIMKGLKSLRVPDPFLMIVTLCYTYIFIFGLTMEEIHLARKGRSVAVDRVEARDWAAGRMVFLLKKTGKRCEDVYDAMRARGYSGDVTLLACGKLKRKDMAALASFCAAALLIFIM